MNRSLLPVLREIGDLKRVTCAGRDGSIASRLFAVAWGRIITGEPPADVALDVTAAALVATRMADLDAASLPALGVSPGAIGGMRRDALRDCASGVIDAALLDALLARCGDLPSLANVSGLPAFVDALTCQPRAGATCPGRARVVLGAPESHAEHCATVAVYAVLVAETGTDIGAVFLAALAHHLHNAAMPDAGFTGEMLLGSSLESVIANATRNALAQLSADLAAKVSKVRQILPDAGTCEGRAFHAADVIDRVLEIEQHLARARISLDTILGEMALVHEGPVKPFHDRVLVQMGLA